MTKRLVSAIALLLLGLSSLFAQEIANPNFPANANGRVMASEFGKYAFQSLTTVTAAAQTVTLNGCYIKAGTGNTVFYPFVPNLSVYITDGANSEAVTVTSVTQPTPVTGVSTVNPYSCTFTATFANAHQAGFTVSTNDGGLFEAMNYAASKGIGEVDIDQTSQITDAQIIATTVLPTVQIVNLEAGHQPYWNPEPAAVTVLAAPAVLTAQAACDATHTFCSDATVAGSASWGSSVYGCVAYVDINGQEGPCSATSTVFTSVASKAIDVGAPVASTGAVGYTIYLSLSGGTYALAYQIPLTASTCTLTTLETVTPACAVTNATYGQVGSSAVFAGYPLATSETKQLATTASATTLYYGSPGGRTTYSYAGSSHPAPAAGVMGNYPAFAITTAAATTVPQVLGTITLPAGFMNVVGKTIRICGSATEASAGSTSTITQIEFLWDSPGSNTTGGVPVIIGGPQVTSTLITSNADFWTFCQDLSTTVASASATGGSIQATDGFLSESYGAGVAGVGSTGPNLVGAAVGSLNLAGTAGQPQRLTVGYLHTTGTDGAGVTLQNLTLQVVN